MNRRHALYRKVIFTVAAVAILWGALRTWKSASELKRLNVDATRHSTEEPFERTKPTTTSISPKPTLPGEQTITTTKRTLEHLQKLENAKDEWRTPIQFFGKVVDENSTPVPDADVHFIWTDLSRIGTSERDTKTDSNGLFNLTRVTGKHLTVYVTNSAYYASKSNEPSFSYAGENVNFVADVSRPIIFQLWKKRLSEPLIRVEFPGF